jgi:integrase
MKKRKDHRYVKRVNLPDGTFKDVYGRTIEERDAKVEEVRQLSGLGVDVSQNPTVAEWCQQWINGYFKTLRPTTRANYLNEYNAHIRPVIATMKLRDVRQVNIKAIMSAVSEQSESSQRNVLSCVRRMFNVAKENRLIAYNPCDGVHITERSDIDNEDSVLLALDDKQKETLLEAVKGLNAEIFVNLGVWCGLRREESLGLQWTDIDFDDQVLNVRHTVTFPDNKGVLSDKLKHKASRREIPIPPPLMEILEAANPNHDSALKLVLHHKKREDETVLMYQVCPDAHGGIMSKSSYTKFWQHVENSVPFEVRSHMLRHTYCTWLYDNGIDVQTAKTLMGHSDIRITDKIYTSIGEKQKRNARAKIQSIFQSKSFKNQSDQ